MADGSDPIIVKFIGKRPIDDVSQYHRHFPNDDQTWGRCRFVFSSSETRYDWLVAYDEVPPRGERLACPRGNTMLVTAEPATIKVYGKAFTRQFGHVLTSQEQFALKHPSAIRHQPALLWYFGVPLRSSGAKPRTYDQLLQGPPVPKTKVISSVCSSKAMSHTLHRLRYDFTMAVDKAIPEFDLFGRGIRDINDKAEAMDGYKYHLAIENHLAPHHITEKLTDSYLAGCLPFYCGAPNAAAYFPPESFIPIDIRHTDTAIARIRQAIENDEYTKRLSAVMEAKRITLEEQNLFAVLSREIERLDTGQRGGESDFILNRKVIRRKSVPIGIGYLYERYSVQARFRRHRKTQ